MGLIPAVFNRRSVETVMLSQPFSLVRETFFNPTLKLHFGNPEDYQNVIRVGTAHRRTRI